MTETYMVSIFVDKDRVSTATVFNKEAFSVMIHSSDENMKKLGYRRVDYVKARFDKKHITSVVLRYTRV